MPINITEENRQIRRRLIAEKKYLPLATNEVFRFLDKHAGIAYSLSELRKIKSIKYRKYLNEYVINEDGYVRYFPYDRFISQTNRNIQFTMRYNNNSVVEAYYYIPRKYEY